MQACTRTLPLQSATCARGSVARNRHAPAGEQAGIEDYQTKLEKLEKNIKSSKNRKKSNMESEFDEPAGSDGDDDGGGGKADNPLDDDVRSDGE